jgi:hypothetical protein
MNPLKTIILIILFPWLVIKAQEPKINKNLSFLEGQKRIKFEFTYENLTISGDKEEDFLKKNYLNEPERGLLPDTKSTKNPIQ